MPTPDFLRLACISANVSFKEALKPEDLARALLTGDAPRSFRPHLRAIFEEVPKEVLAGAIEQLVDARHGRDRVIEGARRLAESLGCRPEVPI